MQPLRCWNCGAPLPAATAGPVEHCTFCGAETRIEEAPPKVETAPPALPEAPRPPLPSPVPSGDVPSSASSWPSRGSIVAFVAAPIVLAFVIAGIASARGSCGSSSSGGSSSAAPSKPKLDLGNLATAPFEFGWNRLDPPPIVGSYASFDPEANIGWAKRIGAAWKPDTVLYRMMAKPVSKVGTVNIVVTPDSSVEYRLVSPKCVEGYKSSTAVVDPKTTCELFIEVKAVEGAPVVEVLPLTTQSVEQELRDPVCTMTQAFAALEKAGKLPPRPVYDADVYAAFGDSTRGYSAKWVISTVIHGQADIPVVDATTCKVGW